MSKRVEDNIKMMLEVLKNDFEIQEDEYLEKKKIVQGVCPHSTIINNVDSYTCKICGKHLSK